MNTIRLPFRWERLQPTLGGAFDPAEQNRLTTAVNSFTSMGAYVLLDPHNYARYDGKIIGQSNGQVTNAHFADFWNKLATLFKNNPKVIFELVNEPNTLDISKWAMTCNAAIGGIRSAGAIQLILVPGSGWTGAHSWQSTSVCCGGKSNAEAMAVISDPQNNWAYDLHQYLDQDFSSAHPVCVDPSIVTNLVAQTTTFLRSKGYKAFLSEFGGPANQVCYDSANNLLSHLEKNSDVWLGWTWWYALSSP
jgi:endoglucanase